MLRTWRLFALSASLLACTGHGGLHPGGTPPPDPEAPPPVTPDAGLPSEPEIPPLPDGMTVPSWVLLHRLDVFEYNNTVRDLVGAGAPVFTSDHLGYDQGT